MNAARVPEFHIAAGAVRAELARRSIPRRDAVLALQEAGLSLGRTAAYERIAGLVPFTWTELEVLSTSFEIPLDVLAGTRAPDVAAVRV
ncbi:hypothetical protein [Labedella endophytica]|jgi:hypothetical protein|uniref:XRE family transcriptional regulator n=1 Tax=Labedella endophytica TaxID=1523160 RepID=A0A3S0XQQ4_9MICO|nr:hypothetical protein [Labedella endophytica]RUR03426.1 hypothetical protein ELQ94_02470 [Labedella endophytica]